jgi:hypothetical protein
MRIVGLMLIMLIAGLALGSGGSTLYWSGQMDRQFKAQKEWKGLVDKQGETIEMQRDTIKQQGDALRRLTAATDGLLAATRPPR